MVDAGPLHMHHRPRAASSRRQARLWVARNASAKLEVDEAPAPTVASGDGATRGCFPLEAASGAGAVNRRSDRQHRSALTLPSVAKRSRRQPLSGPSLGRLCDSAAQAGTRTKAVVTSPGRTRLDLGGCDRQPERRPALSRTCGSSPMHSCAVEPPGDESNPGVEFRVPARATVRVGSKAEPRSDSKAI